MPKSSSISLRIFFTFLCLALWEQTLARPYPAAGPPVFQRVLMAQMYYNQNWTLDRDTPEMIADSLISLKPTYISNLIYLSASKTLQEDQIQAYQLIRQRVRKALPNCVFDFVINPREYKSPEEIVSKMQEIEEQLEVDIWYLDFAETLTKARSKVTEAAINYAHQQGKRVGGNEPLSEILKMADFVVYHDGMNIDLSLKDEILKLNEKYSIQVLFQINHDGSRSADDSAHTFVKKWRTFQRVKHLKRLSRNQRSWKYKLMYPVYYPVIIKQESYNATRDGNIMHDLRTLLDLNNPLE